MGLSRTIREVDEIIRILVVYKYGNGAFLAERSPVYSIARPPAFVKPFLAAVPARKKIFLKLCAYHPYIYSLCHPGLALDPPGVGEPYLRKVGSKEDKERTWMCATIARSVPNDLADCLLLGKRTALLTYVRADNNTINLTFTRVCARVLIS